MGRAYFGKSKNKLGDPSVNIEMGVWGASSVNIEMEGCGGLVCGTCASYLLRTSDFRSGLRTSDFHSEIVSHYFPLAMDSKKIQLWKLTPQRRANAARLFHLE